jgi:sugar (pentulose or hexulose) kinase
VRAELTRLFDEQVEFFRRRAQQQPNPADLREYQERRERIRQLFAELRGLR